MKAPRTSPATVALWLFGLTLLVLAVPGIKFGIPPWRLPHRELISAACVSAAVLISAIFVGAAAIRGAGLPRLRVLSTVLAAFGCAFFGLLVSGQFASLTVIVALFAIALTVIPALVGPNGMHRFAVPVTFALAAGAVGASLYKAHVLHRPAPAQKASMQESIVHSAYYNLALVAYANQIPEPRVRGGGFARIGTQLLLATGDGHLYVFDAPRVGTPLSIRPLPYKVPQNGEDFAAYLGQPYGQPGSGMSTGVDLNGLIESWQFRVAGIAAQELSGNLRLFASHHYWKAAEHCMVVRVSMLEGARSAILAGADGPAWRTIFETKPCVHVDADEHSHGNPYTGEEVGGRLHLLDANRLLLTVGDFGFSGETLPRIFAQDPDVDYGKTLLIHLDGGPTEVFTVGHRNPQGLYVDPQGSVWSTEHGPQGGDELNHLVQGRNYGWPRVTYGTNYGSLAWPLSAEQGQHAGFEKPIFAWLPSIAVSAVTGIEKNLFPAWHGDLMVGSLKTESLWRIHLSEGRVVLVEPIGLGQRVRDLIETDDGHLLVWTDEGTIDVIGPAKGTEKQLAYATLCSGCHNLVDGNTHGLGPDLRDVVGRPIASARGYADYSAALKKMSGNWTEQRLDAFLASPQTAIPGTAMAFAGIADPVTRAAVIEYLKTAP